MKTIKRIAGAEFRLLFYSPIAWLVLMLFILQSGLDFADVMKRWMQYGETIGDVFAKMMGGLTNVTYGNPRGGWFSTVQKSLYLYVPLLTMGLMSRELSSGSIKLLLSSPIRISKIVLGKFVAMMGYCLLFVAVLVLYCLCGSILIRHMDMGMIVPALVGTYLLILAYSAIGLFMSSLTPYQVVAALSTLGVLAFMNYIGNIGQQYAFMRALTNFLSLDYRVSQNLNQGLFSSADIAYFLLVILLFLSITIMRMNDGRHLRTRVVRTGRYVGLVVVFLVIGYISSRHTVTAYYDMTWSKEQTISVNGQKFLEKIKAPLNVAAWENLLGPGTDFGLPENRNTDYHFWEKYMRFNPDMNFSYTFYYDTSRDYIFRTNKNAGKPVSVLGPPAAEAYGIPMSEVMTPAQERKAIDLAPEEYRFTRQMETGGKKTFLRFFDDNIRIPLEHEVIASVGRLTQTPPKFVFAGGDFERSTINEDASDYHLICCRPGFRAALINQGFDFDTVYIDHSDIPQNIAALVIADPRRPLSSGDLMKINQYSASGGNLLIAGDASRQAILNPLLASLGVHMQDGALISPSKDFKPTTVKAVYSPQVGNVLDTTRLKDMFNDQVLAKVFLSGAVGLDYSADGPFKVTPLVVSDPHTTWVKAGQFSLDTVSSTFDPEFGDRKISVPVALALTRQVGGGDNGVGGRQQRIIVLSDADVLSQICLFREGDQAFATQLFQWLNYGGFPVNTDPAPTRDNDFRLTHTSLPAVKTVFLGMFPGILLIGSAVVLIRRRRK